MYIVHVHVYTQWNTHTHTHTQVLVFDPQNLINKLSKMDQMMDKGMVQPKKQADAFRTWLSARKHFGAGATTVGPMDHSRRTSAPAVVFEVPKPKASGSTRETERAREVLGQAVASQNKIEQLQEEGISMYMYMYMCTLYILYTKFDKDFNTQRF